ncbi:NAD-dependent epimerase/dehydratase family protein [Actinomycetospora soli]|uniref:NAD-dependent epimerase/dehydratase family protein n=1 Tax=Actinomycetospora soli TaxID=2893887 RepID=UPI001E355EFD|nr:NAD(P)-dependent oxidoreductase [Actinomycetospora soli]MCD2191735.1 NAD(P)-dependent oxidoreductase [Actinomycetospora soli]
MGADGALSAPDPASGHLREARMIVRPTTPSPNPRPRIAEARPHHALTGRRVLVTGARGFIGSRLVRSLLDAGADVHALIRPEDQRPVPSVAVARRPAHRVTWHRCDLVDVDAVRSVFRDVAPEVIFHLASRVQGHRDVALALPMLEDNTRAAVNIMAAASDVGVSRLVLAGSVEEPHVADEAPCSPYAAAKAATTSYARMFADQWDLPVTVLRLAMVYGPGQTDERKLVPHVATSLLRRRAPSLASGSRPIDWVYIDDVCDAFLTAASHPQAPGLVADIGSGTSTTIADTVRLLAKVARYDGDLGFGRLEDRRNDVARIADLTHATGTLGWQPRTPLPVGLARTLEWFRAREARAQLEMEAVS